MYVLFGLHDLCGTGGYVGGLMCLYLFVHTLILMNSYSSNVWHLATGHSNMPDAVLSLVISDMISLFVTSEFLHSLDLFTV